MHTKYCVNCPTFEQEDEDDDPIDNDDLVRFDTFSKSIHTCPVLDRERVDEFMNDVVLDRNHLEKIVTSLTEKRRRFIAKSIIKSWGLVRHQIEHYEKFMDAYLPRIIHENSTIVADSECTQRRHVIEFGHIRVYKPTFKESNGETRSILPWECRVRGLTYSCSVVCDIKYTVFDISGLTAEQLTVRGNDCSGLSLCETRMSRETLLCQVPCMLRSKFCWLYKAHFLANECPLDQGGVFIINGNDKDLITQEKLRTNYPCIFTEKQPSKYTYQCEVRSCHETKMRSTSTLYVYISGGRGTSVDLGVNTELIVNVPFIELDIPLVTMYRLLGITSTKEMVSLIMEHNNRRENDPEMEKLVNTILQNDLYQMPHKDLCEWIGKEGTSETTKEKRIKYVEHILANEFLPHIGLDRSYETVRKKIYYFSYCIHKLCSVFLKRRKPDDKDHNSMKRMETSGVLLALLLRPLFRTMLKNAVSYIKRNTDAGRGINVAEAINHKRITSSFKYAMSTGNWGPQKGGSTATGVAQVHNKMTITSGYSNLRKVNTPINKEGKMPRPRQLNLSHWGIFDPVETPEGLSCGLLKNMALGCHIRVGYDPEDVFDCLKKTDHFKPIESCTSEDRRNYTIIIVNGIIAGYTNEPDRMVQNLRIMRQYQAITFDTGIVYRPGLRHILINTESGCCCRPLFKVSNLHKLEGIMNQCNATSQLLMQQLILGGVIEYIGKEEEATYRVAVNPNDLLNEEDNSADEPYTHVEVHPILILGVCSSLILFLNRNQAPRNTYQAAMGKQSQSVTSINVEYRVDTMSMSLCYPEVPLVQTMMEDIIGATKLPMGQTAMMAIASFTGYNQEDSIILNESAVEMGLFRSSINRTYRDDEKTRGTDSTKFERPPKKQCHGLRTANYEKVNDQGFPEPGTLINPGDVIIAKTMVTDEVQDPDAPKQTDSNNRTRTQKRDNSTILMTNESAVVRKVIETKNKEGAKALKVITTAFRQPEIGDKFCLSMDHEVLTFHGWKYYHQLCKYDLIATLKDGKLVYENPIGLYDFDHSGKMYSIESSQVNLQTTLNHKMWVKRDNIEWYELVEAKNIVGKSVSYQKNTRWEGEEIQNFSGDKNSYLVFFGLWISQEWKSVRCEKDSWKVLMYRCKPDTERIVYDIAHSLGFYWEENEDNITIHIKNDTLITYLETCSDAVINKILPEWVWKLSERQCKLLMRGFMLIDESDEYITPYKTLANDIQRLALHCGWSANIYEGWDLINFDTFTVRVVKTENNPSVNQFQDHQKEKIIDYDGTVFCVEVPSHVFYVRRNGIPVWTGNSSRHGQKGTVGMLYRREDLPFNIRGEVPDIIVNPHAMPSRMTVAKLVEGLLGKLCLQEGEFGDGTPFNEEELTVDEIGDELVKHGLQRYGKEVFYHPHTGEPIEAMIFFAPVYYQRLKHVAIDKIHARATGPVQLLTQQPVEGRSRQGGFRVGEMERDVMISYGAAHVLKDRLFDQSDAYQAWVCYKCGLLAEPPRPEGVKITGMSIRAEKPYCRNCDRSDTVRDIKMPYGCKLLFQELMSCGIAPRIRFDDKLPEANPVYDDVVEEQNINQSFREIEKEPLKKVHKNSEGGASKRKRSTSTTSPVPRKKSKTKTSTNSVRKESDVPDWDSVIQE